MKTTFKGLKFLAISGLLALLFTVPAYADPIGTLNQLIDTAKDGQYGFQQASESVQDAKLKDLFNKYSAQRAKFVKDLQNAVARLGGKPDTTGTMGGSLHQGWINLKAAITKGDERAVLAEAEKGEAVAVRVFEDAAKDEKLPADIRNMVASQASQVREAYEKVKTLENVEGTENRQEFKEKVEDVKDDAEDKAENIKDSVKDTWTR